MDTVMKEATIGLISEERKSEDEESRSVSEIQSVQISKKKEKKHVFTKKEKEILAKEKRRLNLIQERDSAIVGIQLQESIQESKVKASSLPRRDSF